MIQFEFYESGDLFGLRYLFTQAGDALPRHQHELDTAHNIIVLSGCVRFVSDSQICLLSAGEVFDFDGSQLHVIEAIESGSRILNLFLQGIPEGYAQLPQSERKGVLTK